MYVCFSNDLRGKKNTDDSRDVCIMHYTAYFVHKIKKMMTVSTTAMNYR